MNEQEIRKRMKEIDQERYKLSLEKKEYENYLYDKLTQDRMKDHKEFIGKCFTIKDTSKNNKNKPVKAFKIIEILEVPNENYALCVALIDGFRSTCWMDYGVQIMTLGLWNSDANRMIGNPSDPRVIDFYDEISQEEFEGLYREYTGKLEDNVFK